jgi:hypothetical protein
VLVIAVPGGVRSATDDAAALIAWLAHHGAPRTGEVLTRLQRHGWTLKLPDRRKAERALGQRSLCRRRADARRRSPLSRDA